MRQQKYAIGTGLQVSLDILPEGAQGERFADLHKEEIREAAVACVRDCVDKLQRLANGTKP